jgi:hypothetical protein
MKIYCISNIESYTPRDLFLFLAIYVYSPRQVLFHLYLRHQVLVHTCMCILKSSICLTRLVVLIFATLKPRIFGIKHVCLTSDWFWNIGFVICMDLLQ